MLQSLMFIIAMHFQADFGTPITSTIEFVKSSNNRMHAYCYPKENKIVINITHWHTLHAVHQRELVYHELGHCMFGLTHEPLNKVAIMRPKLYSTHLDGSNWKQLVTYMKSKIRKK